MAMHFGPSDGDDELLTTINTTPLVDVMLVLLIIFLITIPVVTTSVKVRFATRGTTTTRNQARQHHSFGQRTRPSVFV
jgi:biopolymer transport protein ExbD